METVQQKQEVEHLKAVSSNVCQIIMNNMQLNAGSLRSKSDSFVNLGYSYKGAWLYKDHHYIMQKKKGGGTTAICAEETMSQRSNKFVFTIKTFHCSGHGQISYKM